MDAMNIMKQNREENKVLPKQEVKAEEKKNAATAGIVI